ncbi:MAG: alcohol dehydrogenase catalytic domain-containing protein, partial [Actinomycetota bacterium]
MRAARYAEHGGPEVIEIVDVPDPTPEAGDVVVSVMAASLNRLDAIQRNGWFTLDGFTLPHIAGMDIAGEVIAVGDAVSDVAVGDRVVVDPSMSGVSDD